MTIPIPYLTIGLLFVSNVFMTFAWYGHLKYKDSPLFLVILVSWCIAFLEYCFQVPANRYGHGYFSAVQLKAIQEMITLVVFAGFSMLYLGEPIRWNHLVGFALLVAAAFLSSKNSPQAHHNLTPLMYLQKRHRLQSRA
jgi:hypothetical protein